MCNLIVRAILEVAGDRTNSNTREVAGDRTNSNTREVAGDRTNTKSDPSTTAGQHLSCHISCLEL